MKLLFLCGSRGEWGYIRPIIEVCKKKKINYGLCLTNMVVLSNYGELSKSIRKENYKIIDEIEMSFEGDNHYSMAKSLSVFGLNFIETLKRVNPDWLIIAGDRGEQLMGAINSSYSYIPVAHIQAGERSGNIDGLTRHAIARFSHIHFAANKDAVRRLIKSGEQKFRVFNVGAPQLDEIYNKKFREIKQIQRKYNINKLKDYFLIIFHPVTEEFKQNKKNILNLIGALKNFNEKKIWILPNNDAGALEVKNSVISSRDTSSYIFDNLEREDYLGLMKNSKLVIGNSSSGLIESPSFKIPSVNIGNRQKNRLSSISTINCSYKKNDIINSIQRGLSKNFRNKLTTLKNPYGDGKTAERIIKILKDTKITEKILNKYLSY